MRARWSLSFPLSLLLLALALPALAQRDPEGEEIVPDFKTPRHIRADTSRSRRPDSLKFLGRIQPRTLKTTGKRSLPRAEPRGSHALRIDETKRPRIRPIKALHDSGAVRPKAALPFDGSGLSADGTIAVSVGGRIVAADNAGINVFHNDVLVAEFTHLDFFGQVGNAAMQVACDPHVIYDPEEDKFLLIVLTGGGSPEVSQLLVAFSTTDDPLDTWHIYSMAPWPGDVWLDYPGLSVNYRDFVITGSLFDSRTEDGKRTLNYKHNFVSIFSKDDGYAGRSISGFVWIDDEPGVSIYPVPAARSRMYGPSTYLLSTEAFASNKVTIYKITGHVDQEPDLITYHGVQIRTYSSAGAVTQPGGAILDPGDCRIRSAYYQNGKLYFVFTKDDGHGFAGISYNRIRLSDFAVKSRFFHDNQRSHYAYPAITNRLGNELYSRAVLVYLRSGDNTFPQIRLRFLGGSMSAIGPSVTVLPGAFAALGPDWGDYIDVQKKYGSRQAWLIGHIATPGAAWQSHLIKIDLP